MLWFGMVCLLLSCDPGTNPTSQNQKNGEICTNKTKYFRLRQSDEVGTEILETDLRPET